MSEVADYSFASALIFYLLCFVTASICLAVMYGGSSPATATGASRWKFLTLSAAEPSTSSSPARLSQIYRTFFLFGLLFTVLCLIFRGLDSGRLPWGNMFEYVLMVSVPFAVCLFVVASNRLPLLIFIVASAFLFLLFFFAAVKLQVPAGPVVPALRSYWFAIHISVISIGSGILLASSACSVVCAVVARFGSSTSEESVSDSRLYLNADRAAYVSLLIGFPIFSVGIILGAMWAEVAWGRYWGWDPKETATFICWVLYAAVLHSRATPGWRVFRSHLLSLIAAAALLFDLFFVNMVVSGLHSYAGLN